MSEMSDPTYVHERISTSECRLPLQCILPVRFAHDREILTPVFQRSKGDRGASHGLVILGLPLEGPLYANLGALRVTRQAPAAGSKAARGSRQLPHRKCDVGLKSDVRRPLCFHTSNFKLAPHFLPGSCPSADGTLPAAVGSPCLALAAVLGVPTFSADRPRLPSESKVRHLRTDCGHPPGLGVDLARVKVLGAQSLPRPPPPP